MKFSERAQKAILYRLEEGEYLYMGKSTSYESLEKINVLVSFPFSGTKYMTDFETPCVEIQEPSR